MITMDKALIGEEVPLALINRALSAHAGRTARLTRLKAYFDGEQDILRRQRQRSLPNNRLAHNYARYIATITSGYLAGQPIRYAAPSQAAALETLLKQYDLANIDSVDAELAMHAAIYGRGVEILYAGENAAPRAAAVPPENAFVVYDDTVEHAPLFGVYLTRRTDAQGKTVQLADVYTAATLSHYQGTSTLKYLGSEPHYFGGVPMVEYWNNESERGDFEPVLSLIDAYNAVESDRVNDKQQFTDAILLTRGFSGLADSLDEDDPRTPAQRLRDEKLLMLPDKEADASFLTKQLCQADTEVLKDAIRADIHKFSMVPDLGDEHFAGNASGVAMKFKLFGLEQLTKVKERWFREGLYQRLKLFACFMAARGAAALDVNAVRISFSRQMPGNELEIAQMVATLRGLVPDDVLLEQVPFARSGI